MIRLLQKLLKKSYIAERKPEALVSYSISKYKDTYKWLEDYDRGVKETTKMLADTPIVQDALRKVQARS